MLLLFLFLSSFLSQAGLACSEFPEQLLIALEPEAASIYCRKLRIHHLVPETPPRLTPHQEPPNVTPVMEGVEDGELVGG